MAVSPVVGVDPSVVLLGRSPAMAAVRDELALLAALPCPVRIEGPSGSGKGLAARLLHALSRRAAAPLVLCSLAGVSDSTALGDLLGYRRGAFTGAYEHRAGKLEAAHGGTLFLDELGLATPDVQRALLQFLDTGIVQRLGEVRERIVDARVIFATNANLEALMGAGEFREDLLYRMGQFVVRMPALAERPEDIPLLVEYLLAATAARFDRPTPHLPAADLDRLVAFPWPGNVRQLAGTVEQIVAYGRLPQHFARLPVSGSWRSRAHDAVTACGGNKSAAARLLGVSRQALHQALEPPDARAAEV